MGTIVVIGSNGQLGSDLVRVCREAGRDVVGLTHSEIEIGDAGAVERVLSVLRPSVVLNTAARQGAGTYSAGEQDAYFRVNALAVWNLALWCQGHGCVLVHYSTDYVFGGERLRARPYTEADLPCPLNAYGISKLSGEYFVHAFCPKHYVIRVASLYGKAGSRAKGSSNFVKMVLSKAHSGEPLTVVDDQLMSPTWTRSVATKTLELMDRNADPGLYHMAGSGACSWYELAREIVRVAGLAAEVRPVTTPPEEPGSLFLRPRCTALENARLRASGMGDLPHWRESLEQYIRTEEMV